MHAETGLNSIILWFQNSTEEDQWGIENVEFRTSAAIPQHQIQRLACRAASASAEFLAIVLVTCTVLFSHVPRLSLHVYQQKSSSDGELFPPQTKFLDPPLISPTFHILTV